MSQSTTENTSILCIPDITGFTRFVTENEIEFIRKIIPGLLRNMVDSNSINLKVSEIEGDSVVFYRFGALPPLEEIAEQCKAFYINFNLQLLKLMQKHADDLHESVSSNRLSLKIIVHASEMTVTEINGHTKLIGEDVIIAHKLLKNSIPDPEYILLTEKLLENYPTEKIKSVFDWNPLVPGKDEYEFIGVIPYRYILLDPSLEKAGNAENSGGG